MGVAKSPDTAPSPAISSARLAIRRAVGQGALDQGVGQAADGSGIGLVGGRLLEPVAVRGGQHDAFLRIQALDASARRRAG